MATYLEYLSFKSCLPWYKKILFPLFLNKEEKKEYTRLLTEEKSYLDIARDSFFFFWGRYMDDPNYRNKKDMEDAKWWVYYFMEEEKNERRK